MKTAIQQALEELDLVPMDKSPDYIFGLLKAIKVLEKHLPTEKEQIVEANHCGQIHGEANGGNSIDVAQEYYQETYKS